MTYSEAKTLYKRLFNKEGRSESSIYAAGYQAGWNDLHGKRENEVIKRNGSLPSGMSLERYTYLWQMGWDDGKSDSLSGNEIS